MKVSPARTAAFDILLRIETERAFSSVLLPIAETGLSAADRSLCHELTLGTLRRQIYLDRVIDHFAAKKKLDDEIRIALRLGLYQLSFLDRIPEYSAIDESVNLVQRAKKTSAKGFVNAILRRYSRERAELVFTGEIDRISVDTSHPAWLIEKWANDLGLVRANEVAVSNNEISNSAFRVVDQAVFNDEPNKASPSAFVENCFLVDRIDERLLELAEAGRIYFQDEASQMVAASVDVPPGGNFLDVCAAPGGKTGLIANRHAGKIDLVAAGDLYGHRVEMLRDNCHRQGADNVAILQYNAELGLPFELESFDTVLVDAPCSGTGTIRHNPEIRYFLRPNDFEGLAAKQLLIVTNASKLVKRGGTVTYSTCSLEPEENEAVCLRFLSENVDFRLIRPDLPERFHTEGAFARTWPDRDGMDGFFVAVFRRNEY